MKNSASRNGLGQMYTDAFQQNWESPLFTDYGGHTSTFGEVANKIEALKITLQDAGLKPGDKIAIYARNSSNWATAFFSILAFEGVVVPILPDFTPENAHHILEHSGAKALFVADSLYANLNKAELKGVNLKISTDDFRILSGSPKSPDTSAIDPTVKVEKKDFEFPERDDEDLLILS